MASSELDKIKDRYAKRNVSKSTYSYGLKDVHNLYFFQEKERQIVDLLRRYKIDSSDCKLIELGCGSGGNLLNFLRLGFLPENLSGNDLIEERLDSARHLLPESVKLFPGDASSITAENGTYDIVFFSTVFSSILDEGLKRRVADKAWDLLKPGGSILWYDFTFNNPRNPDVKGVKFAEIMELFPLATLRDKKRITLAPPIARRVCRIFPAMYTVLNTMPFLRTHLLVWIQK